jgi:hypothetical protein
VQYNGFYVPVVYDKLLAHGINSTVQCMVNRDGEVKGIMTFDLELPAHKWTEEDTQYFGLVSQLVGSMLI